MKICFFGLGRLDFEGGAEKYITSIGQVFNNQGHQVYYFGQCDSLSIPQYIIARLALGLINIKGVIHEIKKCLSTPLKNKQGIISKILPFSSFIPFSKKRRDTKEFLNSCDLILVNNEIANLIFFFFLHFHRRFKTKTALLIFTSIYYPQKNRRSKLHNYFYTGFLYRFLANKYDFIIISNKADRRFFENKFKIKKEKIKYIPYGLDPKDFPIQKSITNTNPFRILFVGRLEEQKGIDLLDQVIAKLAKRKLFSQLEFTLVGDGPWRKYVETLPQKYKNISYLGLLLHNKVKDTYLKHHLVVVPSRWETFSYVTLEAQFCGLPVVAFDIPGPQDIIKDNDTGKLVPLANIEKFTQAVEYYWQKEPTEEERKRIRTYAIKNFSLTKTAENLLGLIRN